MLRRMLTAALLLWSCGAMAQVTVDGNVYGGGNLAAVTRGTTVLLNQSGSTMKSDVYGGGALADVSTYASSNAAQTQDSTLVTVLQGTVKGDVYGGALGRIAGGGDPAVAAMVYGPVHVSIGRCLASTVEGGATLEKNVFGGNNLNGTPKDSVLVDIWRTAHTVTNTRPNDATYESTVKPALEAAKAPATYDYATQCSYFALQGVYGGSNKAAYEPVANKGIRVHVHNCENTVKMLYGGGRAAAVGSTTTNANAKVVVDGGLIDTLFAGGDGHTTVNGGPYVAGTNEYLPADVNGNVTGVVRGGYYAAVFAGSNTSGNISGTKSMTIANDGPCATVQDELITSLFGGANAAPVSGEVALTVECGVGHIDEVYGGSNMADITGNVTLTIKGGEIENVFGGSKGTADKAADIKAGTGNNHGNVTLNLNGGTIGSAFGGSNINGNIEGTITVNVNDLGGSCPLYLDNVYGSGNLALHTPNDATITSPIVNLIKGTVGYASAVGSHAAFSPANPGDHGRVFGGGKGDKDNINAGKVTANPQVNLNGANDAAVKVLNAIYGGGEIAMVDGSTAVNLTHGQVGSLTKDINEDNGYVFGGGKGYSGDDIAENYKLATVTENTTVTMTGGYVHNTLFGGGQMASVGTFSYADNSYVTSNPTFVLGEQNSCAANTGKTTVAISGGQVGPANVTMTADLGYVFGAGMGYYTQPGAPGYANPFDINSVEDGKSNARFGYVDNTDVTISGSAFIVGAVWGGSENGQVLNDCVVKIQGGQIGCGQGKTAAYADNLWTAATTAVTNYYNTPSAANATALNNAAADMPECNSWPYNNATGKTIDGTTYHYLPYDAYADEDDNPADEESYASTANPGDGHTFFGNVFGGGSGYYPYRITTRKVDDSADSTFSQWYEFQGRVRGNTHVTISGGHILTSVYGGCEYADVLGDSCTVTMTNGTIGVPRTLAAIEAHPVTCFLYGAGKGDQRTTFNQRTNVNNVRVTVTGGTIFGSVYGGGEDGHVEDNIKVNIGGTAFIGTWGTSYYDGNVFGGGRGFGGTAITAGSVGGNVVVNVYGSSKILGSLYGGGRLASVGTLFVQSDDPLYGQLQSDPNRGNITLNISGGTIGNGSEFTHPLFNESTAYAVGDVVYYENSLWRFIATHAAGKWNTAHVTDVVHTTCGNVFGSSMGRLLKIGMTDETVGTNFNPLWPGLAKCRNTNINITGNANIYSNVYGGGELGYVMGNTAVTINSDNVTIGHAVGKGDTNVCYFGSVFGGGYGSDNFTTHANDSASLDTSVTAAMHAGRVYGNAAVTLKAGHVLGNIYGGGELGSIGRRWIHMADSYDPTKPYEFHHPYNGTDATHTYTVGSKTITSYGYSPNIGNTIVSIEGGTVGEVDPAWTVVGTHRVPGRTAGRFGSVFGGSKGRPGYKDEEGHHGFHHTRMAYVDSARVLISGGEIAAAVFGGGENGHVRYGTYVEMTDGTVGLPLSVEEKHTDAEDFSDHMIYHGNVYGGGRGIDLTDDGFLGEAAGQVFGNTVVDISGGLVRHNVYGGGSIASVGSYVYQPVDPNDHVEGLTGSATVTIHGTAQIGDDGHNNGHVYGSGRGIAWHNSDYSHKAFVNRTIVNIEGNCQVKGCVFGGGANGHVMTNTQVNIKGGTIGSPINGTNWTTTPVSYTPSAEVAPMATMMGITDWYKYPTNNPSDPNYNDYVSQLGESAVTVFYGNVYGGGRGVDRHNDTLSSSAGRVYGNTNVDVSGGTIYHSVYGGGSMASVGYYDTPDLGPDDSWKSGGTATVTIRGGQIGTTGSNNGHVFGSSRGMAGNVYAHFAFVNETYVYIKDGANIKGSVFGSGENGHVLHNTHVEMTGGTVGRPLTVMATVLSDGTELVTGEACTDDSGNDMAIIFNGNVYGGGRGVDRHNGQLSLTAGTVYGNTNVTIKGGTVVHNVYGGGSMASVGTSKYKDADGNYTSFIPVIKDTVKAHDGITDSITYYDVIGIPQANTGLATVIIDSAATIGDAGTFIVDRRGFNNGRVFGAGRGMAGGEYAYRANVFNTSVTIGHTGGDNTALTVNGAVFGGGENGHVLQNTQVNVNSGTIGHNMNSSYDAVNTTFSSQPEMIPSMKSRMTNIGNVYGAGRGCDLSSDGSYSMSAGYVRGTTTVNIDGGLIHRNVYGGGSMALVGDYGLTGEEDHIAGDLTPTSGTTTVNIRSSVGDENDNVDFGGNVYGSSRGRANDPAKPTLDFADMAYVWKTQINVGTATGAPADFTVYGNVYGGGEAGHVDWGGTEVNILSGTVNGSVFGGGQGSTTSPTAGIVDGPALVNIGTTSQYGQNSVGPTVNDYVFGGNDAGSSPLGTMTVNIYHTAHSGANIFPAALTASALAALSDEAAQTLKDSYMTDDVASAASNYALKGVYGGGNEASVLSGIKSVDGDGVEANVLNDKYIEQRINGTGLPTAYGSTWPGGISRKSIVNIYNRDENTIKYVYGGGKAATTVENEVNIEGGRIYQVFAGGDGSADGTRADVGHVDGSEILRTLTGNSNHGNAKVTVKGGTIYQIFGGSNTRGKVYGAANVGFDPGSCPIVNSDVFGGGNQAEGQGDITVTIPCGVKLGTVYGCANNARHTGNVTLIIEGGVIDTVFGGSKSAEIDGNVEVYVYGGSINNLFGGNNLSGNITGTVKVDVDWGLNTCVDATKLGYVFGGGYQAPYEPSLTGYGAVVEGAVTNYTPVVNIIQATVDSAVFGGGFGVGTTSTTDAHITANPKVVIGAYRTLDHKQNTIPAQPNNEVRIGTKLNKLGRTLEGNVFGGGNAGPVEGSTKVIIQGSNTKVWHNVYGGGNAAIVKGNTDVEVGGSILLSVPKVEQTAPGTVTLTSREGATIYYTTDGSEPTTSSSAYSNPLTELAPNTVVKAIAHKDDFAGPTKTSNVVSYTVTE